MKWIINFFKDLFAKITLSAKDEEKTIIAEAEKPLQQLRDVSPAPLKVVENKVVESILSEEKSIESKVENKFNSIETNIKQDIKKVEDKIKDDVSVLKKDVKKVEDKTISIKNKVFSDIKKVEGKINPKKK